MARFRGNERQVLVEPIYQRAGLSVEHVRRFDQTVLLPDVALWTAWSLRISLGGTRYVRYGDHSYALAPGTIFWTSPMYEPVKTYALAGTQSDEVIMTFSAQHWKLLVTQWNTFRQRNADVLARYPERPILALQLAPPPILHVLRQFITLGRALSVAPAALENQ